MKLLKNPTRGQMKNRRRGLRRVVSGALAALLLSGCAGRARLPGNEPEDYYTEGRTVEVERFSFSNSGMSMEQCFTYSAVREDSGVRIDCEVFARNAGRCTVGFAVDEAVMQELGQIAGEYGIDRWDGFDKVNKNVLDGSSFTLSMTLSDGTEVYAHGSNKFPAGYRDAATKIQTLFQGLLFDSGELYPKTLASDALRGIDIRFVPQNETFSVTAAKNDSGGIDLSVTARGFAGFFPDGAPKFTAECGEFPFDAVQEIVRKYDLPAWNGWERYAEDGSDGEFFSISLDYESGEFVFAEGRLHPAHYDEVRQALLELLSRFITENKETLLHSAEG